MEARPPRRGRYRMIEEIRQYVRRPLATARFARRPFRSLFRFLGRSAGGRGDRFDQSEHRGADLLGSGGLGLGL